MMKYLRELGSLIKAKLHFVMLAFNVFRTLRRENQRLKTVSTWQQQQSILFYERSRQTDKDLIAQLRAELEAPKTRLPELETKLLEIGAELVHGVVFYRQNSPINGYELRTWLVDVRNYLRTSRQQTTPDDAALADAHRMYEREHGRMFTGHETTR